jgi:hypothetical protein
MNETEAPPFKLIYRFESHTGDMQIQVASLR